MSTSIATAERTEQQLVRAFRRRKKSGATIADLIADTGLPKQQVENAVKRVVYEYQGHLKVTESGEILYHFPHGMSNQVRGLGARARRFGRRALRVLGRAAAFLFKIWTMVMLVGYFLLFVLLVLAAMAASVVASSKGGGGGGGQRGGLGSFYLTFMLFRLITNLWLYSALVWGADPHRMRRKPKGRRLHQSIFAYLFGDGDPAADWPQRERTAFASFCRENRGVVTLEEVMHLTGRDSSEAQELINALLVDYEGEPDVTDNGTLIYRFPELLRTGGGERAVEDPRRFAQERVPAIPFSNNKGSTNGWITFFNGFNLAFGSYFFFVPLAGGVIAAEGFTAFYAFVLTLFAAGFGVANPILFVFVALGLVPVVFSALFYAIAGLRKLAVNRENRRRRDRNVRRHVLRAIVDNPDYVDPEEIVAEVPERDSLGREAALGLVSSIVERVAAERGASVEEKRAASNGKPAAFIYRFPDIQRELTDVRELRKTIDPEAYGTGEVVFDSNE